MATNNAFQQLQRGGTVTNERSTQWWRIGSGELYASVRAVSAKAAFLELAGAFDGSLGLVLRVNGYTYDKRVRYYSTEEVLRGCRTLERLRTIAHSRPNAAV